MVRSENMAILFLCKELCVFKWREENRTREKVRELKRSGQNPEFEKTKSCLILLSAGSVEIYG